MKHYIVLIAGKYEQQIPYERVANPAPAPEVFLRQFLASPQYPWLEYRNSFGDTAFVNVSKFRRVEVKVA